MEIEQNTAKHHMDLSVHYKAIEKKKKIWCKALTTAPLHFRGCCYSDLDEISLLKSHYTEVFINGGEMRGKEEWNLKAI